MLGDISLGGLAIVAIPILFLLHIASNFALERLNNQKEAIMKKVNDSKLLKPILITTISWTKAIGATALGNVL